ncbi:MAG: class II aldolase/adducin family protein [Oscillospiraceae bacterium]|jgi:rhamnose utilization protein RhaD (predicted bifunctional aldolase and dehydrogenase)|nr:class II aldolase/adducin family protein [Oscillospiraceae bacterium]
MDREIFWETHRRALAAFADMSARIGRPEHVQGGGGNTSVKLSDGLMAVKASGFRLDDITPRRGYALLRYPPVAAFYEETDPAALGDEAEPRGAGVAKAHTVTWEGETPLRPSVEAGAHALLDTYVAHTHTVYANLACCAQRPEEILREALADIPYCFVPYVDPGARLSFAIRRAVAHNPAGQHLIFLQNHGLIASGPTASEALCRHEAVCAALKNWFRAPDYPAVSLQEEGENLYRSATPFLAAHRKDYGRARLMESCLYPDQLVYLAHQPEEVLAGVYRMGKTEALALEELLTAVVYLYETADARGIRLVPMSDAAKQFIDGWESEAYRKSVARDTHGGDGRPNRRN